MIACLSLPFSCLCTFFSHILLSGLLSGLLLTSVLALHSSSLVLASWPVLAFTCIVYFSASGGLGCVSSLGRAGYRRIAGNQGETVAIDQKTESQGPALHLITRLYLDLREDLEN